MNLLKLSRNKNDEEIKGKVIYDKYLKDLDHTGDYLNNTLRSYFNWTSDTSDKSIYTFIEIFHQLVKEGHLDIAYSLLNYKSDNNFDNNIQKLKFLLALKSINDQNLTIIPTDTTKKFWSRIPIINIIYEIFFDETPTTEQINSVLELFGIMGALLFSIVVSVMMSINYDSLISAIDNWNSGGIYGDCWVDGYGQVYYFINSIMTSVNTSFYGICFDCFYLFGIEHCNF